MARERSIMSDPDPFMCFAERSPFAIGVPVLKVVDGDGFLTKVDEVERSVRFGFIDAPELDQRGGCEAREFLTALIGGRKIWIEGGRGFSTDMGLMGDTWRHWKMPGVTSA